MGTWKSTLSALAGLIAIAKDASTPGLIVKRFSSGTTTDSFQCQDELGNVGFNVGYDNQIGFSPRAADNQVQWQINNNGVTQAATWFRLYNPWAGYMFQSQVANFDAASFRPGVINPYNSLGTLKISGLAATAGKPTSGTWVAGDTFVDSKGTDQLCTTGGTPGTWISGGWQLAGFYKFASALATSGAITIPAFDELMIVMRVVSISSTGDIPALQFNGDTGNNYLSRYITCAAGAVTMLNAATNTTNQARLSGLSSVQERTITTIINNRLATSKVGVVNSNIGTNAVATSPSIDIAGGFEWVNTSAQITSVTMKTAGGSLTFAIDSGMLIFGRDLA